MIRLPLRIARLAAVATLLACGAANAQTLYKLIDKNGKVTYSEEAPKNFDGKVIRIDVNPNANTATLPKLQEPPKVQDGIQRAKGPAGAKGASGGADVEALRQKVADRRAALQDAENNPSEDDVQWVGNAGGGVRRVPSEAYRRRLTELERSLKEAEDELQAAEKSPH